MKSKRNTRLIESRFKTWVFDENYQTIFTAKKFLELSEIKKDIRIKGFDKIIVSRMKNLSHEIKIEQMADGF